jgi:hypothetical protein
MITDLVKFLRCKIFCRTLRAQILRPVVIEPSHFEHLYPWDYFLQACFLHYTLFSFQHPIGFIYRIFPGSK